ncbi:hypothetical protein WMY93_012367 [Mugilogobius chulae]|uniref:Uncharacterized protein n=1 Tax=Mugilogobius chulae TaxID=88201 RepID=A0AAW0PGL0_9GOBI
MKEHQAGEDAKGPGVVEEEGLIIQHSSDVNEKGESNPKSDSQSFVMSPVEKNSVTSAEKERWFVSVNDKPPQQLSSVCAPVVKKKSKRKKLNKVAYSRQFPAQILPSDNSSSDIITPNDILTCTSGSDSTLPCKSVEVSSGSLGDQPEFLPQLDVTMDSPEAFAKATGNPQTVYAISAFWDEMEKLTINDILQIRMGRCMLPIEEAGITDDLVSSCRDDASTNDLDSIKLSESALLGTLDSADSDYCTNLDESKPDRSSWDFSSSDFEEEYWQFINSSRNTSPELHDKSYQSSDCVSTGEESDGMGTPVPSEDCCGQNWSCDPTVDTYDLAMPQKMRKNKSMFDIHAPVSVEDLSSQAFWDRSSCKSLEKSLKMTLLANVSALSAIQYLRQYMKKTSPQDD